MLPVRITAISRNHFDLPLWIGGDQGVRDKGSGLGARHESVDEVSNWFAERRLHGATELPARHSGPGNRWAERDHRRHCPSRCSASRTAELIAPPAQRLIARY